MNSTKTDRESVLRSERDHFAYNVWHFAPARRVGDFTYIAGIIVARDSEAAPTPEGFSASLRTAFRELGRPLAAYHGSFQDVVMLTTFHDWSAPEFLGDAKAQAMAFQAVKDEIIPAPHPAWTAVETTGFVRDDGILEIQAVAFSPQNEPTVQT